MGNRITGIDGTVSTNVSIAGSVKTGKSFKELKFMLKSDFPYIGADSILYIAIDEKSLYMWDGSSYSALSGYADIIDDSNTELEKTWSSVKINDEFLEDRRSIDKMA